MDRSRSVLIVDDDDTLRATLKKIFAKAGYDASTARDGQEAIDMVRAHGVDLVLADLKMPRTNGLSLLDSVRKIRPESKVILMSAYGADDTQNDALARGAYAYLNKPVSRKVLLGLCEEACQAP
ncbi:response regulator [bacterium]|nr:response regulator [bacterium]